jgi:PhzF family phenazine biosynthesis protein
MALVDAFTDKAFSGNPAGVCLLEREMPEEWMQNVAAEMNQAETAFLIKEADHYRLRWFTPAVEVDLCGHATLASAKYLYEMGLSDTSTPISFETRSGRLTATPNSKDLISLDFPSIPSSPIQSLSALGDALGADPLLVHRGRFDYLVELKYDAAVRDLQPDLYKLKQFEARGIVVTAQAAPGSNYDFISRGFFPQSGIDEDPVTGSAHCMLAPFWAERLSKTKMTGYQASKRGGYVRVELVGDRVKLIGQAVIVMEGELHV